MGKRRDDRRVREIALALVLTLLALPVAALADEEDDVEVEIYGFVLVNTHYNDAELTPVDIPVAATHGTRESFSIFPRQTRVGLRLKGPEVGEARTFGQIEIDLWGLRGSSAPGGITQSAPRFRLALLGLRWPHTALTVGQDWVKAFAPLMPTSLSHQAVPPLTGAGNLWNRLPQIRLDHQVEVSDAVSFQMSGALLRPFGADEDPEPASQSDIHGGGEFAGMPFYEVRLAVGGEAFDEEWAVGLSGHYGQEDYNAADLKTSAVALDFNLPLGPYVILSGEAFDGENLKMLFANAYRYGNPDEDPGAVEQNTQGGWIQLAFFPTDKLSFNLVYGMEELDEARVSTGEIQENSAGFANAIYSLNRSLKVALEVLHLETKRLGEADEDGNALDLAVQFVF